MELIVSRRTILALVVAVSMVSGCSWVGLPKAPSATRAGSAPVCEASYALPVVDTIITSVAGLGGLGVGVWGAANAGFHGSGYFIGGLALLAAAAIALPYAFSARYGYRQASACEAAHKQLAPKHPVMPPAAPERR